ncbi:MAG TPA: mycothiol system anti-sigma-R factor [Candidatus Limnocylindrales bacterium]|nr:mycothiol system anti-sigma-R factor [Candidatus Limnocylindrales bacterium]
MSKDCDSTMDRLSLYLDRELSEPEMRQVRVHLDDCPPCGKIFDFQAELKRLVRKECCTDDAPTRLREWVRKLAAQDPIQP